MVGEKLDRTDATLAPFAEQATSDGVAFDIALCRDDSCPGIALCIGFTDQGLPLGMQIAARWFHDALVLQVGHAYEKATTWHEARPRLMPGPPALWPRRLKEEVPAVRGLPTEGDLNTWLAERAGLHLDETQLGLLRAIHPHADAMAARLRRPRAWSIEGSNVFRLSPEE